MSCIGAWAERPDERRAAYRQLLRHHLGEKALVSIREATNKAWVLGSEHFKQRIQKQLERRVEPKAKGGDRKSTIDGVTISQPQSSNK